MNPAIYQTQTSKKSNDLQLDWRYILVNSTKVTIVLLSLKLVCSLLCDSNKK